MRGEGTPFQLVGLLKPIFSNQSNKVVSHLLFQNVYRAHRKCFKKTLMELIDYHQPMITSISETRISRDNVLSIISTLGFKCQHKINAMGNTGGLWIIWGTNIIEVTISKAILEEDGTLPMFKSPFENYEFQKDLNHYQESLNLWILKQLHIMDFESIWINICIGFYLHGMDIGKTIELRDERFIFDM